MAGKAYIPLLDAGAVVACQLGNEVGRRLVVHDGLPQSCAGHLLADVHLPNIEYHIKSRCSPTKHQISYKEPTSIYNFTKRKKRYIMLFQINILKIVCYSN